MSKTQRWNDFTKEQQQSLLAMMPTEVQERVKRGEQLTDNQIKGLMEKHYDLSHSLVLYKVDIVNPNDRKPMRITKADAIRQAKVELRKKHGAVVDSWTEVQLMSMNVPPKPGYRWEVVHMRNYDADDVVMF